MFESFLFSILTFALLLIMISLAYVEAKQAHKIAQETNYLVLQILHGQVEAVDLPDLSTPPADTTDKLYVVDGELYWNGSPTTHVTASAPGVTGIARYTSDGKYLEIVQAGDPPLEVPVPIISPEFSAN
jgi:hypothetical protein